MNEQTETHVWKDSIRNELTEICSELDVTWRLWEYREMILGSYTNFFFFLKKNNCNKEREVLRENSFEEIKWREGWGEEEGIWEQFTATLSLREGERGEGGREKWLKKTWKAECPIKTEWICRSHDSRNWYYHSHFSLHKMRE